MRTFAQKPKGAKQTRPAKSPKPGRSVDGQNRDLHSMPHLQRTIGNQAIQRLLKANIEAMETGSDAALSTRFAHDFNKMPLYAKADGRIQPKLTIGTPDDIYEREADRVAEQVMHMPEPRRKSACAWGGGCPACRSKRMPGGGQNRLLASQITSFISRQPCGEEEETQMKAAGEAASIQRQPVEEEEIVQTKPSDGQNTEQGSVSEAQLHAGECAGQPLSASARSYFEPRFGHDFNDVRVHTRDNAVQMNQTLNARAFTHGNHIFFNRGQYSPETYSGKHLLSHELTHVLQQDGNRSRRISCNPSPDCSVWGGFRICGSTSFRSTVVSELTTLNGTSQGRGALSAIETNREPWYRSLIRINERSYCGFLPVYISYNATGCNVRHRCRGAGSAWQGAPNYVYLFHEIAHVYEYLIGNRGTHRDRECMVTGLGNYFNTIPYNENKLRCELGLPVRPCYNGFCTAHAAPACSSAGGSSSPGARSFYDNPVAGPVNHTAGFMINREAEPAEGDADTAEIVPCPDQDAIQRAKRYAGEIIATARRRMTDGPVRISEDDRNRGPMHWFYILFFHVEPGDLSVKQIHDIKENFNFLERALPTSTVRCATADHPDCSSGGFSHLGFSTVGANSSPTISLCPGFFNADGDTQARTIIHELAHARIAAEHAGGRFIQVGCHETPLRSFSEAINNAYVYDNFAMCLHAITQQPERE